MLTDRRLVFSGVFLLALILLVACAGPRASGRVETAYRLPPRVAVLYPDEWLTLWKAVGPFDNADEGGLTRDALAASGGEKAFSSDSLLSPVSVLQTSPTLQLLTLRPGQDGAIDLRAAFGDRENVVAYAWCDFLSPDGGYSLLRAGSNDGARIWVNGSEVLNRHLHRAAAPDQDLAVAEIRSGLNRVLVKVEQAGGDWKFYLRFGEVTAEAARDARKKASSP